MLRIEDYYANPANKIRGLGMILNHAGMSDQDIMFLAADAGLDLGFTGQAPERLEGIPRPLLIPILHWMVERCRDSVVGLHEDRYIDKLIERA